MLLLEVRYLSRRIHMNHDGEGSAYENVNGGCGYVICKGDEIPNENGDEISNENCGLISNENGGDENAHAWVKHSDLQLVKPGYKLQLDPQFAGPYHQAVLLIQLKYAQLKVSNWQKHPTKAVGRDSSERRALSEREITDRELKMT